MKHLLVYLMILAVCVESRGDEATLIPRQSPSPRDYIRTYSYAETCSGLALTNLETILKHIEGSIGILRRWNTQSGGNTATVSDKDWATFSIGRDSCLRLAELSDGAADPVRQQVVAFLREKSVLLFPLERTYQLSLPIKRHPPWQTLTDAMLLAIVAWDNEKRADIIESVWSGSHTKIAYDRNRQGAIVSILAEMASRSEASALAEKLISASRKILTRNSELTTKDDFSWRMIGALQYFVFRHRLSNAKEEQTAWQTLLQHYGEWDLLRTTTAESQAVLRSFAGAFTEKFSNRPKAEELVRMFDRGTLRDRYLLCFAYLMIVDEANLGLEDPVLKEARKVIASWPTDIPLGSGTLRPLVERIVKEKSK